MIPLSRLALQLALVSPALGQSTWYVDAGHTPPGSGSPSDPFVGIQQAIDAPSTLRGDTILVPPQAFVFVGHVIVRDCAGVGVKNEYDVVLQHATIFGNGLGFWSAPGGVLWQTRHLIVWGNTIEADVAGYFGGDPITHSILPTSCAPARPRSPDPGSRREACNRGPSARS